uniref:Uncharacterized protein n=1 Tax=Lepeophtheirus salmonis TaxID=72036 RepID=A0A0K2UQB7_LEPSM
MRRKEGRGGRRRR